MEEVSICQQNGQSDTSLSALSDFAQIYSFLQRFGFILRLPSITLNELEDFFISGYCLPSDENQVVYIHWRLLHNVGRSEGRKEWQRMALKLARRNGLMSEPVAYDSLTVEQRMKLFRLACEEQFDYNMAFKNELKKQVPVEALHSSPIGLDYDGQRHWLLKDTLYDIRLYGETDYDQAPPEPAVWVELAKSLDELGSYITVLDSRSRRHQQNGDRSADLSKPSPPKSDHVPLSPVHTDKQCASTSASQPTSSEYTPVNSHSGDNEMATSYKTMQSTTPLTISKHGPSSSNKADGRSARPRRSSRPSSKVDAGSKRKATVVEQELKIEKETNEVEGCMQCHKDVDYEQMLLCDECEKECHTYCQYPRLWTIPEGKWVCPICREDSLISELKKTYHQLSEARAVYERTQERKQRSVARLQKSGLLLQNIITNDDVDDSSGRKSRRSRKEVNYAELNDVYLPPLGPQDYVGAELGTGSAVPLSVRTRRMDYYIQEDYLAPRVRTSTRRFRGSPEADVLTTTRPAENEDNSPLQISKVENISESDSESPKSVDERELELDYEIERKVNCDHDREPHLERHVRFEEQRQMSWVPDWTVSGNKEKIDSVSIQSSSNHAKTVCTPLLICDRNELAPKEMKVDGNRETESMEIEASNISSGWTATENSETSLPPMV